jgi:tRNA(Ile)-lysidine synthase TilS/MesJ
MSTITIPTLLIDRVSATIDRYSLISGTNRVLVAFSGGKDSAFAASCLKAAGYNCTLATVDLEYSPNWRNSPEQVASALDLPLQVLSIRNAAFRAELSREDQSVIDVNLDALQVFSPQRLAEGSPCTNCYNTKITALRHFAIQQEFEWIVFGHHATDAIVSLLKSAFMYIDRWDYSHPRWDRRTFEKLIAEFADELIRSSGPTPLFDRVTELAQMNLATTDEPPVQDLRRGHVEQKIARPLLGVLESEIVSIVRECAVLFEPSNCGHGSLESTRTPREMIHYGLFLTSENRRPNRERLEHLMRLVELGLSSDGRLISNSRERRSELLGADYRPGLDTQTTKL